ncbi:hypothetical protein [Flavobacterium bizetiae]|nr:hypothetical protein [Flavobacterium bizetiae]
MKKNSGMAFAMLGVEDDESIDKFVNENIELVNVRPTDKDEDLKKCDCATQISFKFSEELIKTLKEKSRGNLIISVINEMMTKQLDYKYTLQKIKKDNQLLVEGIVPVEELQSIFMNYKMIQNAMNKQASKNEGAENLSQDASNDKEISTVKREDTDISANSGEIITEKSYIYKKSDYSTKIKMYLIKGDVFDIGEEKDGFYDIYYHGENYDKNIEGYIPTSEMKLLYLDKYGNKTYIEE